MELLEILTDNAHPSLQPSLVAVQCVVIRKVQRQVHGDEADLSSRQEHTSVSQGQDKVWKP